MSSDRTDAARALGIPPMRRRRIAWIVAIVLVVVGVVAATAVVFGRREAPPSYLKTRVRRGDIVATVTATGSLEATNTVTIGAEVNGRVRAVRVEENDRVSAGQVLVEIDPTQAQSAVREADANVAAAVAALRLAEATRDEARQTATRSEQLRARDLASQQDFLSAQAAAARADAEVDSAVARLRVARETAAQARTNLGKTNIVAPIAGVVLERTVEPGQTVIAALQAPTLLTLAEDLARMSLRVQVDEADVGHVRDGQRATFTVDAYPEREFEAVIQRVRYAPETVSGVVTYEATMSVDNAEGLLRPGMTATATIITDRREGGLLVPNAALRFEPPTQRRFGPGPSDHLQRGGGPHVWILENGRPRRLNVRVLASDDRSSEIAGNGVRDGLEVITDVASPPRGR